ncbi:MAG TPA: hypothetical protein GX525_02760 [Bacilli bacterium]|nr:hypothetical protein [Bacilli bacterium]
MAQHSFTSSSNVAKVIKKLILFVVLFWVVSSCIYLIINYMYFSSFGGNSGAQINHVIRSKYDAYIFGASRASHHYDPTYISQHLGLSCFNAGDDGKNAVYQYGLLQLLLKNHVPKLIIYEIGDITKNLDAGTVDLYPYYYKNSFIRQLLNERDKLAIIKFLLPLYSYNNKVFSVGKGFVLSTSPFETGFRPIDGKMHSGEVKKIEKTETVGNSKTPVDHIALKSFKNFIKTCNENNIKLLFCFSPSYTPRQPAGLDLIQGLAAEIDAPVYNYGEHELFSYNPELFKDAGHLNREGAELFTKLLIEDMDIQVNR